METLIKFLSISVVWLGIIYFIQHRTEMFETDIESDVNKCDFKNVYGDSKDLCIKKCKVYGIESGKPECDPTFCETSCENAEEITIDDNEQEIKVICIAGNNEILLKWDVTSFGINNRNDIEEFKIYYFLSNDTDKGINIFKVNKPECGWSTIESVKVTHLENDKEYSFQIVCTYSKKNVPSSVVRAIPSNMNKIY
jgi:hypothetical protein